MTSELSMLEIAKCAFNDITSNFPNLQTRIDDTVPVELSLTIPIQSGLKYEVNLNLQNYDELHFSVSHFWFIWFPCTNPLYVDDFVRTVLGFLSGKCRIVEHYQGHRCIKSELQSPLGREWKTIYTSFHSGLVLPWVEKRLVIVSNN